MKFEQEGEPVTRVDFFDLIKTLNNGSAVRPSSLPICLLHPHTIQWYGGKALADTFPRSRYHIAQSFSASAELLVYLNGHFFQRLLWVRPGPIKICRSRIFVETAGAGWPSCHPTNSVKRWLWGTGDQETQPLEGRLGKVRSVGIFRMHEDQYPCVAVKCSQWQQKTK